MIDNAQEIALPCPGCGHKTLKSVEWLRRKPASYVCVGCGKTVQLDGVESFADALDSIDDDIDDLGDTFRRLSR